MYYHLCQGGYIFAFVGFSVTQKLVDEFWWNFWRGDTSWLDFGGDHDPGPEFLTEFSPLRGRDSCTKFVVLAAFVEVCSLHVYACI